VIVWPNQPISANTTRELTTEKNKSNSSLQLPCELSEELSDTSATLPDTFQERENSVEELAHQVTVRVFTNPGAGSGVIIKRKGQTYTVLTNDHVANGSRDNLYRILTADGKLYSAYRKPLPDLEGVDLALVEFKSAIPYCVAVLRNYEPIVGEVVYATGFPNYRHNSTAIENTFEWGLKAFELTTGTVSMLMSEPSLPQGYKLGYTNDIELGMSGGPVLDYRGQVIGINGRPKYPFQGSEVFRLTDGTTPSPQLFKQMEALSWAIPIASFQQIISSQ